MNQLIITRFYLNLEGVLLQKGNNNNQIFNENQPKKKQQIFHSIIKPFNIQTHQN